MMIFWQFHYCWLLQSVLECVALSLPSLSRPNQSWIPLICTLLYEVSIRIYLLFVGWFHWEEAFQAKTLYDPLLCSPIACDCACLNSCVVLGDVVVNLRQETKDYQGLKYAKCRWLRVALVTKGPEELFLTRSFGVSCLTGQHWACKFTEWTPASPAKSMVSQIKPRLLQAWMRNHMRHGFESRIYNGFTMFYQCSRNLSCWKHLENVDILGLDIESSGLNSVILRLRGVQLPFPYVDFWTSSKILTMFFMVLMTDVLKTQVCATCTGWLHLGTRVVSAMIRPNARDHFGSLESYISKTIRPTWATSCLLLSSLRGCCVALSSVTTVHHFRLFWFFLMPRVSCTLVFTFFWNQGWWLWTSEAQNPLAV